MEIAHIIRRRREKVPERMEEVREIIAASGISAPLWWLYGMLWLLSVVPGLLSLLRRHPTAGSLFFSLTALVLFMIIYT